MATHFLKKAHCVGFMLWSTFKLQHIYTFDKTYYSKPMFALVLRLLILDDKVFLGEKVALLAQA